MRQRAALPCGVCVAKYSDNRRQPGTSSTCSSSAPIVGISNAVRQAHSAMHHLTRGRPGSASSFCGVVVSHTHSQCKVMTGTAGGRARASSSRWPSCRGGAHAICGRLPAGKTGGEYRCCQAPRSTSLRLYHRAVCITAPWRSPGSRNFCKNIYLRQRLRRNTCDPHRPARLHVLPGNSTLCTGPPVCP